jgi:predicted Na+-dependent transporter
LDIGQIEKGERAVSEGRSSWFYIGLLVTVLGLVMLLLAQAPLGFYVGTIVICIGLVLFGMGLRRSLSEKNPSLGNIVLIGSVAAAFGLAYLAYIAG